MEQDDVTGVEKPQEASTVIRDAESRLSVENGDISTLDTLDQTMLSRPRSNASEYAKNYKVPSRNNSAVSRDPSSSNLGTNSSAADSTKCNENSDDVLQIERNDYTLKCNDNIKVDGSIDSDELKVIVSDNEDMVVKKDDILSGSSDKMFVADLDKSSIESEEPEPGAAVDILVPQKNVLDLRLVVPGSSQSGSDDEISEIPATFPPEVSEIPATFPPEEETDSGLQEYCDTWFSEKKHVFIFSEAGKPIYSRYGKEENIVGLFGVMQALLSCVQDQADELRCIRTCDHLFVFRCHHPLVLVAISQMDESEDVLCRQLKYLANQAVFFLTQSHLTRLFKNRYNYDLRRQLTGLPKFFDGIIKFSEQESSFLLESIRCLPMSQSLRNEVVSILMNNRCPELVFAIVLYENQIISIVRPKQYAITPQDLHLLMNYVRTGSTRGHGEKWAPCCLPDFNDGGYLYIHDSYISDNSDISLVLITNEREQHITMIECKQRIVEQMEHQKTIDKLETVIRNPFRAADTKIPGLHHFIYKSKSSRQLVAPDPVAPYNTEENRFQLHRKYCDVYDKLHHGNQKLTIYYTTSASESIVGHSTTNSEIYCTFSPYVTRPVALNNIDKLLRWIRREENRFFILGTGVY